MTSHKSFLAIFISSCLPQVSQPKEKESDVEESHFPGSPAGSSGAPGHFSSPPVNSDLNSKKVNTTVPILQTGELKPRVKYLGQDTDSWPVLFLLALSLQKDELEMQFGVELYIQSALVAVFPIMMMRPRSQG